MKELKTLSFIGPDHIPEYNHLLFVAVLNGTDDYALGNVLFCSRGDVTPQDLDNLNLPRLRYRGEWVLQVYYSELHMDLHWLVHAQHKGNTYAQAGRVADADLVQRWHPMAYRGP